MAFGVSRIVIFRLNICALNVSQLMVTSSGIKLDPVRFAGVRKPSSSIGCVISLRFRSFDRLHHSLGGAGGGGVQVGRDGG